MKYQEFYALLYENGFLYGKKDDLTVPLETRTTEAMIAKLYAREEYMVKKGIRVTDMSKVKKAKCAVIEVCELDNFDKIPDKVEPWHFMCLLDNRTDKYCKDGSLVSNFLKGNIAFTKKGILRHMKNNSKVDFRVVLMRIDVIDIV